MPINLDFLSRKQEGDQFLLQCSFLELLLYKMGCYKGPVRLCTEFSMDSENSKIEELQKFFQDSTLLSASTVSSMNGVYESVLNTAYENYPIDINSISGESSIEEDNNVKCSFTEVLLHKVGCYRVPLSICRDFKGDIASSKAQALEKLFFQGGIDTPNALTTAYKHFQTSTNEGASQESLSCKTDSAKPLTPGCK